MRILAVADLHYALPQFDWLLQVAPRYDLVIIAGDMLDGGSFVTSAAQMVVVLKYLERLRGMTRLMVCSGNHDLNHVYSNGEKYARWVPYVRSAVAHADNDTIEFDGVSFSICPWWDGSIAKNAIGRQLKDGAAKRGERWFWVYHAPPAGAPVSWSGSRSYDATTYLADIKHQFADRSDHLGMVDEVLEALVNQQAPAAPVGSGLKDDPRL